MNFANFWLKAQRTNPALRSAPEAKLTVEHGKLEKLLEQAYNQGLTDGYERSEAKQINKPLFERIFG